MGDSAYNLSNNPDSTRIPWTSVDNTLPMNSDPTMVPSEAQAYAGDLAVLAVANSKTAVRFWDNGTFQNGTPNTGDMIIMTDSATVSGGAGNVVFNLTSDHTSTGTALCSAILSNSCVANFVDKSGVFSQDAPVIAGSLKTVTFATTKQAQSGVVVLTITVVGTVTQPATANGTAARFFGIGISV